MSASLFFWLPIVSAPTAPTACDDCYPVTARSWRNADVIRVTIR